MKTFSSKLLFYVKKSILKSAPKERQFISRFLSSLFPYFLSSLDPQFLNSYNIVLTILSIEIPSASAL